MDIKIVVGISYVVILLIIKKLRLLEIKKIKGKPICPICKNNIKRTSRENKDKIGERLELAGLMPLWQREFDIVKDTSKIFIAIAIFLLSLMAIIFNFLPIIVAFLLCILAFTSIKLLTGDSIYRHIDWPVVILLAAMIPIGNTLTDYGITSSITSYLASYSKVLDVVWILIILMVMTNLILAGVEKTLI